MKLINGECIEEMKKIEDKSVDMILCDLPYGTTNCKWDTVIPFDKLWEQYNRIIKDNGAIVLFSTQPFTTQLIASNKKGYKYELIWDKTYGRQPHLANIQPMRQHENILIFSEDGKKINYYPQKEKREVPYFHKGATNKEKGENSHKINLKKVAKTYTDKTPTTILKFKPVVNGRNVHPTQKPTELLEYLIKTYTNEGELILDNTMGSGSTGVAAKNTNRHFIGIELDENYFNIAKKRIEEA